MMAISKYLKNPIVQYASSISNFYRNIKNENIKRIDVILEDGVILSEKEQNQSRLDSIETRTTYEAVMPYRRKIKFVKNNKGMSQLEAIAYTGRRLEWLEDKLKKTSLKSIPITFKNRDGNDISHIYKDMLRLANKALYKKIQSRHI